jgi:hypothetical protein
MGLQGGFNDWQTNEFRTQLNHLNGMAEGDWWKCEFDVPPNVYNMSFIFSDGGDCYDKHESGDDYTLVPAFAPSQQECVELMEEEKRRAVQQKIDDVRAPLSLSVAASCWVVFSL